MSCKKKQHRQEDLQRISALCLMDDNFMSLFFKNNNECAELILRIILDRDDLKVTEVKTQELLKHPECRSICLDIYAADTGGNKYNVEVQRANDGANCLRARYHSSMIDADMLKHGEDFSELCESYVIFITENDVLGLNEPIYHIDRVIREGNVQFNDRQHIIYVNGAMKSTDTALGRLMSDFFCKKADDMHYKELAKRVRYFKESEEGVDTMCQIWDEVRNEGKMEGKIEGKIETAKAMIKSGKLSLEDIAEMTGFSVEQIRELAGNKSA